MPSVVDVHCHFIPPALIDRIEAGGRSYSITVRDEGAGRYVDFAGRDRTQTFPPGMLDLDARLAWMDEAGIDLQVLSAWMDFSAYALEPEAGLWLARSFNDLTVEAIAGREDRFRAMAAVPLQEPELAAQELERAVGELGMVGVEIATSVGQHELDDEGLSPFWSAAEALDVVVLVHPYASIGLDRLGRYFFSNIVSNPAEETVAAAHFVFGGVLERHPRLRMCLTHGGGFLPYQIGRQDRGFVAKPELTARRLSRLPSSFLPRFLYDTIVHSPEALRFLVERVGHGRVVLGSDQPFPMGDPDPVATVESAGFDAAVRAAILGGNAAREWDVGAAETHQPAGEAPPMKGEDHVEHSFLVHHEGDHVGVAISDIASGREAGGVVMDTGRTVRVTTRADVPLGHKVALRRLEKGEHVVKYGVPIGHATADIDVGDYVHTHNLRSARW